MLSAQHPQPVPNSALVPWGPPAALGPEAVHVVRSALTLIKGWAEYGALGLGQSEGPDAARAGRALAQVILAADALADAVNHLAAPPVTRDPRPADS